MKYVIGWCYKDGLGHSDKCDIYYSAPIPLRTAEDILSRYDPFKTRWLCKAPGAEPPEPPAIETSGYVEIIEKEPLP